MAGECTEQGRRVAAHLAVGRDGCFCQRSSIETGRSPWLHFCGGCARTAVASLLQTCSRRKIRQGDVMPADGHSEAHGLAGSPASGRRSSQARSLLRRQPSAKTAAPLPEGLSLAAAAIEPGGSSAGTRRDLGAKAVGPSLGRLPRSLGFGILGTVRAIPRVVVRPRMVRGHRNHPGEL